MRFRKLRIALTLAWVVVALMFGTLWVRSYWFVDYLHVPVKAEEDTTLRPTLTAYPMIPSTSPKMLFVNSYRGGMSVSICVMRLDRTGLFPTKLGIISTPAKHLAPRNYYVPTWHYNRDAWGDSIGFPIWLPALVASVIGGGSWFATFGFRFSLRTLIIAMTLVAVILGVTLYGCAKF